MRKKLTNINKLWHSNVEEPEEQHQILINVAGYCYVVFYHKKKERRFYDRSRPHFLLQEISKWMYIYEIL